MLEIEYAVFEPCSAVYKKEHLCVTGHNFPGIVLQFATQNPGFATQNPGFEMHCCISVAKKYEACIP